MDSTRALILGLGGVAAIGLGLFSRGLFMPRSQLFGKVVFRGDTRAPSRIAITFDDGPDAGITPAILECLGNHGVKATFFVLGKHAAQHPQLIERMDREGHIVANHSYEHAHLGTMRGSVYWQREISRTDAVIQQIIGKRPALFRPPMGFKTHHLMRAAKQQGHTVVTWTRRAYDGVPTTSQAIIERLNQVNSGDIVMLHDGAVAPFHVRPNVTEQALGKLLHRWREREIAVQRLDELLDLPAYAPAAAAALL